MSCHHHWFAHRLWSATQTFYGEKSSDSQPGNGEGAGTSFTITNNGCGRAWMSEEEGKPSYEKPFCELVIKQNDSTIRAGKNFNPIYIGNVKIVVDRMNPWGREEDSVPAGGCRVIISKLSDTDR